MRQAYTIVIERGPRNLSAYVPDVPGCVTTGVSVEEIQRNMVEALEQHLRGLMEDGEPLPASLTQPADVRARAATDRVAHVVVDVPNEVPA